MSLKSEGNPKAETQDDRHGGEAAWGAVLHFPSDFARRASLISYGLMAFVFAFLLDAVGAQPATNASQPFLRLREATLGYHGPDDDLTNLTEIRIGWFGPANVDDPLTGDLWWAASLAVREANARRRTSTEGGICADSTADSHPGPGGEFSLAVGSTVKGPEGRNPRSFETLPIRLVPRWAVDPWGTGVSQLTRMVYDEQPLALLSSVDSASTHLAEQVVAKASLPLVSPITTDKTVTLAGVSWMFACAPPDDAIARVLVANVLDTLQGTAHKLVLLNTTDHESRMTAREILKEFSRHQHPLNFRFEVPPGAQGIARQVTAIEELQPVVVLIVAGAEDAARMTKALRARIPGCILYGSHSMGRSRFLQLAGSVAEGVRFPLLCVPDRTNPATARFLQSFAQEHAYPPDYTAFLTYDATNLLLEAIRRGGFNRARIREIIPQLAPWNGLAGQMRFDGTGQNTHNQVRMGVIRNGVIETLPDQAASNPTEYRTSNHESEPKL